MKKFSIDITMTNEQYERCAIVAAKKNQSVEEYYEDIINSDKHIVLPKWFTWVMPLITCFVIVFILNIFNRLF